MACTSCGAESPAGARFCMHCAAALPLGCGACGAAVPKDARFCPQCAHPTSDAAVTAASSPSAPARSVASYTPKHLADKILASRSALEGERKQVTVLFADVKGSMELAEQLDPEAWHKILERFFEILAEGVHRFEGTVNQYTGDGIMALFGAPIAHEDHAQRACYAALALQGELRAFAQELRRDRGLDFATRIGLNSGEVVVGSIGDDLRMDYTAQGHTVGLAQRMEALAEAGSVYVAPATAALALGYFELADLGEFKIRGSAEPLRVHELRGLGTLRSRLDVSRSRGFSKFVGRAAELATLEAALERALAGHGQVVGLVADAGTGKSRLCFEFAERCRARGIAVRTATGVAHGKAVPLLPVLEFYRGVFGISERDSDARARQQIAGTLVAADESLVPSLPLLYDFLGVPDPEKPLAIPPGPERQRRLLALLHRLTIARGERRPAVILFEDLHWIDDATAVFVQNLIDATDASRTLMLVNFRPEFRADWTRRSYYQQIALAPLGAPALEEMLAELLGTHASLAGLAARIHARTSGNPFFAEEIAQSLMESGALLGSRGAYRLAQPLATLALPASVQVVLAARIDRLGEREKAVLQTAAVIGREFSEALLLRVAELPAVDLSAALRALVQAEFLHETALYPEAEYAFKHPLTQEVAAGSQLRERRARVHGAVARALGEMHAEKPDPHAALLAHHFEEAGDTAEAAHWHRRAAEWIGARDTKEALAHWRKVAELLARLPETDDTRSRRAGALAQIVWFGGRAGLPEAEIEPIFRDGLALARGSANARAEALLLVGRAFFVARETRAMALEGLAVAERSGDVVMQLVAGMQLCGAFGLVDLRERVALADRLIALADDDVRLGAEIVGYSPLLSLRILRFQVLNVLGRLREAEDERRSAQALLERGTDPFNECSLHTISSFLAQSRGDLDHSLREALRGVELAESMSNTQLTLISHVPLLQALVSRGDYEAAQRLLAESRARYGAAFLSGSPWVARLYLGLGDLDRARREATALVEQRAREDVALLEAMSRITRALASLRADGADARTQIEDDFARTAELIDSRGLEQLRPSLHEARAEFARALGDEAGHARELRVAHRLYIEMGADGHAQRLAKELAA